MAARGRLKTVCVSPLGALAKHSPTVTPHAAVPGGCGRSTIGSVVAVPLPAEPVKYRVVSHQPPPTMAASTASRSASPPGDAEAAGVSASGDWRVGAFGCGACPQRRTRRWRQRGSRTVWRAALAAAGGLVWDVRGSVVAWGWCGRRGRASGPWRPGRGASGGRRRSRPSVRPLRLHVGGGGGVPVGVPPRASCR